MPRAAPPALCEVPDADVLLITGEVRVDIVEEIAGIPVALDGGWFPIGRGLSRLAHFVFESLDAGSAHLRYLQAAPSEERNATLG